ncbi:MAG: ATP-binding protein [Bacteroidetes bacterium]|nr:ATP-binding protein [Bacteroidota bacterium]
MKIRVSQYFFRSPDEIGFDNYLVLVLLLLIVVIGFLATITNYALQLSWYTTLSTAISTAVFLPIYFYTRIRRRYIVSKYAIVIFSLLILNIQWFINYGSTGPVLYLFIVLESFIIVFFKNYVKLAATIILLVNITVLFAIEYYQPGMFGKYPTDFARLSDLYIGMIVYFLISVYLINVAVKFYVNEQKKAQLADKLKSAFLANMSHEIRTPMNGILGFAELLKEPNLNGDLQQKYIAIIEKSGTRMLNIINDIMDISKIESGVMKISLTESSINEQVEFIYNFFKPEVEAKGIRFSFKTTVPFKESIITTDREKVYAILTNLVKNAIKYTDRGDIEFGYEIVQRKKTQLLQFYVKDTGIGISRESQAVIFERFVQADIADKMARQGAGLGLSITKAYVEMLGGTIWVDSEEGNGSVFYFTLPYDTCQQVK